MAKESRKHERLAAERRRKEKELAETLERGEMIELGTGSSATAECADSSTSSSDTNSSARGSAAASASRPKRLKITKEVAAAADRVKLTSRGAHHVFSAIAADQGVLSPSTSSIRRHRKVLRKETADAAVKDYRNQVQEHDAVLILHWDGKLLPGSESQGHVDRLAIVVTSPSPLRREAPGYPCLAIRYRKKQWPAKSRRPSDTGSSKTELEVSASTPPLQTRASMLAVAHSSNIS
ncbi:hypothetical protein GWK47_041996 [Chionoecetes opilio]|uniref:Uncharacterized protein n=1 Tax=Chionoecetes opilio TaxID=41210 RepID=A0A8J4Y985_CHIOP|nr:hypothetical protein GWK47_041996 [Chionoecetes opilio]